MAGVHGGGRGPPGPSGLPASPSLRREPASPPEWRGLRRPPAPLPRASAAPRGRTPLVHPTLGGASAPSLSAASGPSEPSRAPVPLFPARAAQNSCCRRLLNKPFVKRLLPARPAPTLLPWPNPTPPTHPKRLPFPSSPPTSSLGSDDLSSTVDSLTRFSGLPTSLQNVRSQISVPVPWWA